MTKMYTSFDMKTGEVLAISERLGCDTKHMPGIVFEGNFEFGEFQMVDGLLKRITPVEKPITPLDVDMHVHRLLSHPNSDFSDRSVLGYLENSQLVPAGILATRNLIRERANTLKKMDPIPQNFDDERWWK